MKDEKVQKIKDILESPIIDIVPFKKLMFGGIIPKYRPKAYRILLKNANLNNSQYSYSVALRDNEYKNKPISLDEKIESQILLDILRIEQSKKILDKDYSTVMLNILMKYANERPSVGYVQGMSDILCVFINVFCIDEYVESGAYYCFSRFMDNIQNNYVNFQKNIFKLIEQMRVVVEILEPVIIKHFMLLKLEFHFFAFRWFNCAFVREFNTECLLKLFDTMIAVDIAYNDFMVFFGASFLISMKEKIVTNDFTNLMHMLQEINRDISEKDMELLLAKAFVNYNIFAERNQISILRIDNNKLILCLLRVEHKL